ncbi:MAG: tetratricopeptide repeat protein [Gemmobacter sp.]
MDLPASGHRRDRTPREAPFGTLAARFWTAASLALAALLVAASTLFSDAPSSGPPAPDQIVARLDSGTQAYPEPLKAALAAQRAAPGDAGPARAAARLLIDTGRARGDSRLVGAAIGVLRPFLGGGDAQVLYLSALARQYQHDFPGALDLLDRAAALDGRDINTLLNRATIRTVMGDYAPARADCARIAELAQPAVAFLCQATTHVLTAEGPAYRARLEAILAQPGLLDPALHPWALGLVGEIARHQGDLPAAEAAFRAVLQATPDAQREALLLADLLLARGDAAGAGDVLTDQPGTDGVLIRRQRIAAALGLRDEATTLAATLDARFRLNLDLGLTAHAREEAMYFLDVAPDADLALARARVNWAAQHEIEDAELLQRAARAAGRPQAAQPVTLWMAEAGVTPPPDSAVSAADGETRPAGGP